MTDRQFAVMGGAAACITVGAVAVHNGLGPLGTLVWVGIAAASAVFVAATFVLSRLVLPDERDFIARMNIGKSMGGAALGVAFVVIGASEGSAGWIAGGVALIAIFALLAYALWRGAKEERKP